MNNLILANPLENLTRIEYHGQLVLTTAKLADFYDCNERNIRENFNNNAERFTEDKHYFKVDGDALNILRNENFDLQISPQTRVLYLWTKRGCARHCKSVGTDKAWDVFEVLEENYFSTPVIEKPLPSISNYKLAMVVTRLAAHAEDPYTKRKLVAKAANLLFGEGFVPVPDCKAVVQLNLFKGLDSSK